jgi:hypothetical protein
MYAKLPGDFTIALSERKEDFLFRSSGMPIPVSLMSVLMRTELLFSLSITELMDTVPLAVNLIALLTRLISICY